jgi:hypothetical protein
MPRWVYKSSLIFDILWRVTCWLYGDMGVYRDIVCMIWNFWVGV